MEKNEKRLQTKIEQLGNVIAEVETSSNARNNARSNTQNSARSNTSNTNNKTNKNKNRPPASIQITNSKVASLSNLPAMRRNINKMQRMTKIAKPDQTPQVKKPSWRNTLVFSSMDNVEKMRKNVRNYPSGDCVDLMSEKVFQFPPNVEYRELSDTVMSGGYGEVFKATWTEKDLKTGEVIRVRDVAMKHFREKEQFKFEMGVVEKIQENAGQRRGPSISDKVCAEGLSRVR
jgi:hypothetical protein